jgi:hypothetical protein
MKVFRPTTFQAAFAASAKAISDTYGIPIAQVSQDLQAGLQQQGFKGYGRGFRDTSSVLSSILPDTSSSGLFGAPAVALYAFGAVILGLGLFVALKKK